MSSPEVSVVIVVHNGERYLQAAIETVLGQERPPVEVVVIDDGSSDASRRIATGFGSPVRCISQAQRGIAGARNQGVAQSTSEYVAFLDADDLWTPSALTALTAPLRGRNRPDLVFGHVRQFISSDLDLAAAERFRCEGELTPGYLVGGAIIRRAVLDDVGGFDEGLGTGDFIEWITRARDGGCREALVPEHVLWRRMHRANHGIVHADRRGEYAQILKRALDRRRAAAER